jgi:hypothetical protein
MQLLGPHINFICKNKDLKNSPNVKYLRRSTVNSSVSISKVCPEEGWRGRSVAPDRYFRFVSLLYLALRAAILELCVSLYCALCISKWSYVWATLIFSYAVTGFAFQVSFARCFYLHLKTFEPINQFPLNLVHTS